MATMVMRTRLNFTFIRTLLVLLVHSANFKNTKVLARKLIIKTMFVIVQFLFTYVLLHQPN